MPASAIDGADDQPEPRGARARRRAARRAGSRRTSARGTWCIALVDARDLQEAADDREHRQRAHGDLHRRLALGDVVLRAGEADVGVLDLAGHRVGRLGRVVEVPVLELLRLRARVAGERAEDHPERVDGGHERADVAGDAEDRRASRRARTRAKDLVLGEEAGEGGMPDSARPPITMQRERERHRLAEAAHAVEVLDAAHRRDDRAGGHEQQRLEERVRHQVEHARRRRRPTRRP